MNNQILKEGYLYKVKDAKTHHMFGKSVKRYFVINAEDKTFGYKLKPTDKKFKKLISVEVSLTHLIVSAVGASTRKLRTLVDSRLC